MRTRRVLPTALTLAALAALAVAPAGAVDPSAAVAAPPICAGATAPRPCAAWTADLPAGTVAASAASPDGRVVYHATRPAGVAVLRLTAHDARTGADRWTRDLPAAAGHVTVSATGDAVHAVAQQRRGDRPGPVAVTALDAATGRVTAARTYDAGPLMVTAAAVTARGVLLVGIVTRGARSSVVARYVTAGRTVWAATVPNQEFAGQLAVAPDGTTAYVTGDRWGGDDVRSSVAALALRPTRTPLRWQRDLGANTFPLAVLRDGRTLHVGVDVLSDLVTGRAYVLHSLDAATGRVLRSTTLPRSASVGVVPSAPPIVYVGYVGMRLVPSRTTDDVYAVVTTSPYGVEAPYDSYAVVRVTGAGTVAWTTDVTTSAVGAAVADPAGEGVLVAGTPSAATAIGAGGAAAAVTRVAGDGTPRSVAVVGTDHPAADWHVESITVAGERVVLAGSLGAPHAGTAPAAKEVTRLAAFPAG